MKTRDGEKVPKVYTTYPVAYDAIEDAGLDWAGLSGGFLVLQTKDMAVKFRIPFMSNATTIMCYAKAFQAGIKYAQHLAAQDVLRSYWGAEATGEPVTETLVDPSTVNQLSQDLIDDKRSVVYLETYRTGGRRDEGIHKERTMTTEKLIRIDTEQSSYFYALDTDTEALDAFAVEAGYNNYADLASFEGMTVEKSVAELHISRVTYREAAAEIIDEALESNAVEDGAEDRFKTSGDWSDWCLEGKTGRDVTEFAKGHKLDADLVRIAVAEALRERSIDDINAAFPLVDGVFESEDGTEALDPEAELPSVFFNRVGGTVTRFWYTGQETYDCHERREDEHGQVYWYGLGSRRIDDDTTVAEFEYVEAV